mmetsp:Transcript_47650/g.96160  ORF Transcript_47650/g.96160 Transcript_47650/m.96160 type:complete len:187 (-) Transcript_47650:125-685(-)
MQSVAPWIGDAGGCAGGAAKCCGCRHDEVESTDDFAVVQVTEPLGWQEEAVFAPQGSVQADVAGAQGEVHLPAAVASVPQSYGPLSVEGGLAASCHVGKDVQILRSGPHWRTIGMVIVHPKTQEALAVQEVVAPSLIAEWNEGADEIHKVNKGDRIVAVNGATTVDGMLRIIQASGKGSSLNFRME